MAQVGLLGGTFDPVHVAHLVVADQVLDQLGLDEVRLVVTDQSWQKAGSRRITDAEKRLAMVAAAVAPFDGLVASDVELRIGGPSYTIETLAVLEKEEPDNEWSVIVGADAAAGLDTWHRADELRESREFVVVNRPGSDGGPPPGWRTRAVEIPSLAVSSTEIRGLVAAGRSVRHLVPEQAIHLVGEWGLYREAS
ncbi:MAG: nicotinate-nucleotide adenylyltransferase [Actinomycetota bacterium]